MPPFSNASQIQKVAASNGDVGHLHHAVAGEGIALAEALLVEVTDATSIDDVLPLDGTPAEA
ncbi:MAG TPA: hypothetical protein VF006_18310 [Longimicrobium sp.]